MIERGWDQCTLSLMSNVGQATISRVLAGGNCKLATAKALLDALRPEDETGDGAVFEMPNLKEVCRKYPEIKYALMYAGDENQEELYRTIVNWAKKIESIKK